MNIFYNIENIKIYNQNTLLLGATIDLKKKIKKELSKIGEVIDTSYTYSFKTVGEVLEKNKLEVPNIGKLALKNVEELTFDEYYYLALLIKINVKSKLLVIDNLFGYLNNNQKTNIIKMAKKNKITLIIFDNELYPVYDEFNVIVIYQNKVAIEGIFKEVVKEEKILKRLGYALPFYVDLSIQLKLFGLINHICYTKADLEASLWK